MNQGFKKSKKTIAVFLASAILFTSFSPLFAKPVNAQWVDWANLIPNTVTAISGGVQAGSYVGKEFGLDALAWAVVNAIINRMAASTVQWINTGFQGSPAYVTDPKAYFQEIGDRAAGVFISSSPKLNFLCGPISAQVKIALSQSYTGYNERWQCTLSDAYGNMDDFLNDFERGGWDKFFRMTQEPQNNPIGAYLQAEGNLARVLAQEIGQKQNELNWGKGFMSFETCTKYTSDTEVVVPGTGGFNGEGDFVPARYETKKAGDCVTGTQKTETPGSVISDRLNSALNLGNEKLAVADEINEIVSALLNQLVTKALGGLRGLSSRDPSNQNGSSFTDILASSTPQDLTDAFGQSQNYSQGEQALNIIDSANSTLNNIPSNNPGSGTVTCEENSDGTLSCSPEINRTTNTTGEAQQNPGGGRAR